MAARKNFSDVERMKFLEIIRNSGTAETLESKKYDSSSIQMKNEAWGSITKSYNAQGHEPRSTKQLITLWRDLKQRAKKEYAIQKKERSKTGGGSNTYKVNAITQYVIDMLPSNVFEPLHGVNDCDKNLHEESQFFHLKQTFSLD